MRSAERMRTLGRGKSSARKARARKARRRGELPHRNDAQRRPGRVVRTVVRRLRADARRSQQRQMGGFGRQCRRVAPCRSDLRGDSRSSHRGEHGPRGPQRHDRLHDDRSEGPGGDSRTSEFRRDDRPGADPRPDADLRRIRRRTRIRRQAFRQIRGFGRRRSAMALRRISVSDGTPRRQIIQRRTQPPGFEQAGLGSHRGFLPRRYALDPGARQSRRSVAGPDRRYVPPPQGRDLHARTAGGSDRLGRDRRQSDGFQQLSGPHSRLQMVCRHGRREIRTTRLPQHPARRHLLVPRARRIHLDLHEAGRRIHPLEEPRLPLDSLLRRLRPCRLEKIRFRLRLLPAQLLLQHHDSPAAALRRLRRSAVGRHGAGGGVRLELRIRAQRGLHRRLRRARNSRKIESGLLRRHLVRILEERHHRRTGLLRAPGEDHRRAAKEIYNE